MNVWLSAPGFVETRDNGWRKNFDGNVLSDYRFSARAIVGRLVDLVRRELIVELVAWGKAWIVAILFWWDSLRYRFRCVGEDGGCDCQGEKRNIVLLGQSDRCMAGILS